MGRKVYIIGAGGMARETLEIYARLAREDDVIGFLEEACTRVGELQNFKPIWDLTVLERSKQTGERPLVIAAIGSTKRNLLIERLEQSGFEFDTVVDATALISKTAHIGAGSIIAPGVIINCQVSVQDHVIVNVGAHIAHDAEIGEYSTVSPGVEVSGNVKIGERVFLGTNSTIIENITIGDDSMIGAGATVIHDVSPLTLVAGTPAKVLKRFTDTKEKKW